jgi:hypothetical protein
MSGPTASGRVWVRFEERHMPREGLGELALAALRVSPDGFAVLADGEPRTLRTEEPQAGLTLECLMTRLSAEVRATLQTALDATSDAFAVYDVERGDECGISGLRLVLINLAGAQPLASGDPDELVGQDLRDFYPEVRWSSADDERWGWSSSTSTVSRASMTASATQWVTSCCRPWAHG